MRSTAENRVFLAQHNPSRRVELVANPEHAVENRIGNPRLKEIAEYYGSGVIDDWNTVQLALTFKHCGFDFGNNNSETTQTICEYLRANYQFLRIDELMLFYSRFEMGRYGDLGRVFNMQHFFTALQHFIREKNELREQVERRQRQQEREAMFKNAVPPPDYILKRFQKSNQL